MQNEKIYFQANRLCNFIFNRHAKCGYLYLACGLGANSMKKRTKQHVPRMLLIPKIIRPVSALEAYPDLALEFHLKLVAARFEPSIATVNQLSKELCVIAGSMSYESNCKPLLGRKDMAALAIMSAIKVLESIVDRYARTGKVFVSELEGKSLVAAANGIHSVLSRVSKRSYEIATLEVEGYIKPGKTRIAA